MKKLCFCLLLCSSVQAQELDLPKAPGSIGVLTNKQTKPTDFTFMVVHVINEGKTDNQKFFVGRLPKVGEAVEMIYIGDDKDGSMKFQLRTRLSK